MSLEFFNQNKPDYKGPQFINTPGWIPGHAQRDDVRLHHAGVKKTDALSCAPVINKGAYKNLQEVAVAPRGAYVRQSTKTASKDDKPKDLGERLAQCATKGEISCHKTKRSREKRRFLQRGDEFIKKALKNNKIEEPRFGNREPVRLMVDYPPEMSGQDADGDTGRSTAAASPGHQDHHPINPKVRSLKLPIPSRAARLNSQDDVAPIIRLLRMLGICGHSKASSPPPRKSLEKVIPALVKTPHLSAAAAAMSSRSEYLRHVLAVSTRPLKIQEARPPFKVNSWRGLPSAYPGLDYNTMVVRLRYAVEVDMLDEGRGAAAVSDKLVELSVDDDDGLCEFITQHVRDPQSSCVSCVYGCLTWLSSLSICPCIYHYDVQALLHRPRLFMLSQAQWDTILARSGILTAGSAPLQCLDIGAGCGDLTSQFMHLFQGGVTATEVSKIMCRRLSKLGIRAVRTMDPTLAKVSPNLRKFEAVFCLNVLDRCQSPDALIKRIAELVKPGGTVVVSIPLPLAQLDASKAAEQQQHLTATAIHGIGLETRSFGRTSNTVGQHVQCNSHEAPSCQTHTAHHLPPAGAEGDRVSAFYRNTGARRNRIEPAFRDTKGFGRPLPPHPWVGSNGTLSYRTPRASSGCPSGDCVSSRLSTCSSSRSSSTLYTVKSKSSRASDDNSSGPLSCSTSEAYARASWAFTNQPMYRTYNREYGQPFNRGARGRRLIHHEDRRTPAGYAYIGYPDDRFREFYPYH
ncbi:Methyltransferase-like protein 9 [Perkinsus chesapeaki]|uniref:Methyltransferase-like protein 9 n=1 Tax=Perkinsus chesapeaki TaxID=330153 RepID=A0A7J6MQP9_PERCH|nr:Methyltransferase-like protein 9 [Perkinsus chesapeaki]